MLYEVITLTSQTPRGFEIADYYRSKGLKVICGGIATMLHAEEAQQHADSVFLGEAETRFEAVIEDFKSNKLKKVYDYLNNFPPMSAIVKARRDILRNNFV